jgi:hypothetical protein
MTNKQLVILKGLLELSENEKKEVIKEALDYETKTFSEKRSMNESFEKAQRVMGPINSASCPCCGR